jgi:hypothetical protein
MAGTAVEPTTFVQDCVHHASALIRGRPVVLAGVQLAASTRRLKVLRELGVQRCFVVASGVGTGPLPEPDDAESIVVPIEAPDMMSEMRATEALLADPPSEVVRAVDRFDPDGTALLLIATVEAAQRLGDRAAYGPRHAAWVALEDKTVCDALFDAAGVPRPPSRVVPASLGELRAAANSLDRGAGTVWAGDAREGFNGGGTYVRWVHGDDDGSGASRFFAAHCDRVRVAPFVDGLSCSVHGFVTDDGVAVFRPVELINLRRESGDQLQYAGCATFWDPASTDRELMRAAARRLGEHLRDRVEYRGCFTLDGIMGPDGFVATECNPRPGAGMGYAATALPDLPFDILQHLAVAGDAPWLRAAEFEATVIEAGDRLRAGGGWTPVTARFGTTTHEPLVYDAGAYRAGTEDEERDATLTIGPGASGGFLRVDFNPARTATGPSVGPLIAAAFAYADAAHGTGIGPVTPAAPAR